MTRLAQSLRKAYPRRMERPFFPHGSRLGAAAGLLALALLVAAAVAGWARHGEAIFLSLAGDAWAYCF